VRDALTQMDQSDLDNHVQRTADWLRMGINPNANGTENEIAQGLKDLSRRLQDAEQALGREKPQQRGAGNGDPTEALNQVEQLRSWIEGMGQQRDGSVQRNGNRQGQQGQQGQPGQNGASAQQSAGSGNQAGGLSRSGDNRGGPRGGARNGDVGGPVGDTRYGYGADGTVWGNFNTGNNTYGHTRRQQGAPTDSSGNPADTERSFEQNMSGLNQLRQMVQGDPQTAKDVAELTRLMRNLDPRRFPGNPAEVERMHQEMLNTVGRLELQLQRDGISSDARTGKPYTVPAGYKDAVAEYYKRLSKNP